MRKPETNTNDHERDFYDDWAKKVDINKIDVKLFFESSTCPENRYLISEKVIKEVVSRKIPGIEITHIFYENSPINGKKISISGLASSRERLLLFRQSFENYTIFKKVDLPISNFVKGSNIQFNLNLTPL